MTLVDAIRKEYQDRGFSSTITIDAALTPGGHRQYGRDSSYLKAGRRQYGIFNTISIINQSDAVLVIRPDYVEDKKIVVPPGIIIGKDGISFQEFDLLNVDASETMAANTVYITFGFEPPLLRDHKAALGARRG
jgi:hypothetical protein